MSTLITKPNRNGLEARATQGAPLPALRVDVQVRPAMAADVPFIDTLQKAHTKQVGWMPRQQLQGKLAAGHVLVAEEAGAPVGYVIGNDQYFKRDDCGIIYQVCVATGARRGMVGAALVKAMFNRAAYGCRLFCCWCAQDIEANRFWEGLGFVPLAFRAGSEKKARVHIFWQRRIRADDHTTPYWFPSQTTGGSLRSDRLVFPIPPGTNWSDAKPLILPSLERHEPQHRPLPGPRKPREAPAPKPRRVPITRVSGLRFEPPTPVEQPKPKPAKARPKVKNDPLLIAAARELRDRWLEKITREPDLLAPAGKYGLARELADDRASLPVVEVKALPEAA
jgi:N-acetylglutamate synthase-like GNAT family acetyltransferase